VVYEIYETDERNAVLAALTKLLGSGQREFSNAGVYVYWDNKSHEILYLGLARDLCERFAQHNGLVSHGGGNKAKEIDAYFEQRRTLGLTILIQSAAISVLEEIGEIDFTLGAVARDLIAVGEGQLIEMHRLAYGDWPAWNRTGGSKQGQRWATPALSLLEMLAGKRKSLFAARNRLRPLTESFKLMYFESTIHAARLRAVQQAHDVSFSMPDEPAARREKIEKVLMLRDGALVQDLDSSDSDIQSWLERLADPEHWRAEAAAMRSLIDPTHLDSQGARVLSVLEGYVSDAIPEPHMRATTEILDSGYLDHDPLDGL
jgi:hypothetical protein